MAIRYKVRQGDLVTVIAGKDKGKSGKVISVIPGKGKVLVERVNMVKRHSKPSQKNQAGGIIEKEAAMPLSKVMLLDPRSNKPSRVGRRRLDDGTLVRVVKKTGEMIETPKGNA